MNRTRTAAKAPARRANPPLPSFVVTVCGGARCSKGESRAVLAAIDREIDRLGLQEQVSVNVSGCLGLCATGPVVVMHPRFAVYGPVTPGDVPRLFEEHIFKERLVSDLVVADNHLFNRFYAIFGDVAYYGKQLRIALRNCGVIDPESADDYLSVRGYEALAMALTEMTPAQVVAEVKRSGLRGRGGAGFPTGLKWELTARAAGERKVVICNADEGDPGAFMDRSAIEGDPHTVIEGMIIGGYAVGAAEGIVYIRAEYPLAIRRLEQALAQAREHGFLGKGILGSGFDFDIAVRLGAGAFVCGEETALIASVEGHRGMPRPRPPYPSERGLFDRPTLINNVETWANIPVILLDGADWFASIGTEKSKGTKVFALAGNVVNTGLVEVPMGTSLRQIIYGIGGGIPKGRAFKAVQTGGPSGGCLPEAALDTPIDYESLAAAGSIMGSGGMIVMDEGACMVNVARFFLEFTQDESCGKCTPCREGTKRMLEILDRITEGRGEEGDIAKLERLGAMIQKASLCGLGQSAPNPVLSTLKNFRHEYEEHIRDRRCRAHVCSKLLTYTINDRCTGCGACRRGCPSKAVAGTPKAMHVIDQALCTKCGACHTVCRFDAVDRL
jgi:NADH:ubiquinone oxidoreductase subunit F (NADH-binding)/(2Fe-2S) ferredoxin/NAD-dependent dihydropyrimidine dehydrogenase PreA subunit